MTYNTPNSVWTDERVEQLKALWAEGGLSCAGIAAELGGGISRNAVIGKATRLGLTNKSPGTDIRTSKAKRPRTERTIHKVGNTSYVPRDDEDDQSTDVATVTEFEAQAPPTSFLGITFKKINANHCRYIRTVDGQSLYCGQPKIEISAYCAECHKRCHSSGVRSVSEAATQNRRRGMLRALAAKGRAA